MDSINENKIREMYALRRPLKWISRETGMSEKKIKDYLINNNLWTGHKYMLMYFNEFFFDKIDTEEKAYWLGFIYADGYISKPHNIGIELKSTDASHLEKFKKSLNAEHEVRYYKKQSTYGPEETARFQFASKHMFEILLSYYKSIHKTFEGEFPKLENKELIPHLIRGFFDGDGSLAGRPKRDDLLFKPCVSFIGTQETLKYIEEISGFSWSWSQRHPDKKTNNYQISVGRVHDSINFLNYMYSDSTIYLDRKYNLYQELLLNREQNKVKARV